MGVLVWGCSHCDSSFVVYYALLYRSYCINHIIASYCIISHYNLCTTWSLKGFCGFIQQLNHGLNCYFYRQNASQIPIHLQITTYNCPAESHNCSCHSYSLVLQSEATFLFLTCMYTSDVVFYDPQ